MSNYTFKNGDLVVYRQGLTFIFLGLDPLDNNYSYCLHPLAREKSLTNCGIDRLPTEDLVLKTKSKTAGNKTLADLVRDNYVFFDFLRQGYAYYVLHVPTGEEDIHEQIPETREIMVTTPTDYYRFSIPLDEIGGAALESHMKAIAVLPWIRKAYESGGLQLIKKAKESGTFKLIKK